MADNSCDSNNISNKPAASDNISCDEETVFPKACILLAESEPGAVPYRLQRLCDQLKECTAAAYLTAALQLLMLESGFSLPQSKTTNEKLLLSPESDLIIDCKTTKGGMELSFQFTLREVSGSECKLIITALENVLLVNSLSKIPVAAYSVVIPIDRYVPRPDAPNLHQKYEHLEELSLKFKNAVAAPARATVLSAKGIAAASLVGLPPEILNRILLYCGPLNVCNIAVVCRALSVSAKESSVWFLFFKGYFESQVSRHQGKEYVDWFYEFGRAYRPRWRFQIPTKSGFVKMMRVRND